jgi:hypothetical protein
MIPKNDDPEIVAPVELKFVATRGFAATAVRLTSALPDAERRRLEMRRRNSSEQLAGFIIT